ncbi:MAG: chemotaxis protein CheA [Nitrospiraceae bacterium]|nr:chemotaxis protein CheA [Nitrospiraceae bacterium]
MKDHEGRQREIFREEAQELLGELELSLLELEKNPEDAGQIGRAFRALHTIKGSGAMFGFCELVAFAHELETVFDLVRNGKVPVTNELISITLESRDLLQKLLDPETGAQNDAAALLDRLRKFLFFSEKAPSSKALLSQGPAPAPVQIKDAKGHGELPVTYRIRFRPAPDILSTGTDPVLLIDELRRLGQCKAIAHVEAIPELEALDPEACYIYWDIILTTKECLNAVRDVFIFVEGDSELQVDVLDGKKQKGCPDNEAGYKKIGEIPVDQGDLALKDLDKILPPKKQKPIGESMAGQGLVTDGKASALAGQQCIREKRSGTREAEPASSIRVPSLKLDKLADLVGELVTVQARLSRFSLLNNSPELTAVSEGVERLTEELRDTIMNIRLVPIETVFSKLKRTVRDLSAELGKEVELEVEGAETELDKSLIEKLGDPLVHLVRNSIDHGIECPRAREACGKPRKGVIRLQAAHSGANVFIRVMDDGRGLDPAAIKAKAVERGLVSHGAEITGKDLYQLIFTSGFSTAKEVTTVSGRGVGMDVVKKNIESLRGTIDVESRKGEGMNITLRLPLTLAIIDGLLVMIADSRFVIPLSIVKECVEHSRTGTGGHNGMRIANVRGEMVPYISLRSIFGISGARPEIEQIVITEADGKRVGFLVDSVIGENQTVIKTLGSTFKNTDWISGATILGDGSVALIVSASQIIKWMEQNGLESTTVSEGGIKIKEGVF